MLNEGLEVGEDEEISDNSTTGSSSDEKEATEAPGQDDGNGCEDNKSTDQNEQKNSDGAAQKGSNFTKSFIFERSNVMPLANYLELWHAELVEMSPRYSCNKITMT